MTIQISNDFQCDKVILVMPYTNLWKWIADCMLKTQEIVKWKTVYRTPFLCTKITKLIIFQFKLLHRRLVTNSFLTKINLKDNKQCTFCPDDKETPSTSSGLVSYPLFLGKVLNNGQSTEENFEISLIYHLSGIRVKAKQKQEHKLLLFDRQIRSPSKSPLLRESVQAIRKLFDKKTQERLLPWTV